MPLDPNKITMKELLKYRGQDFFKQTTTLKNSIRAFPIVIMGVSLGLWGYISLSSDKFIYGEDGKGGDILKLKTRYNEDDMAYTREFQRMRFLNEPIHIKQKNLYEVEEFVKNFGGKVPEGKSSYIDKRSPHPKYY